MKNALELTIKGIKCDSCDFKDETVKIGDFDNWLDKPCPKCGANLLTQEDLESTKALVMLTNMLNGFLPKPQGDEKKSNYGCRNERNWEHRI